MKRSGVLTLDAFKQRQAIADKKRTEVLSINKPNQPSSNITTNNSDKTPEQLKKDAFNKDIKQYAEMLVYMKEAYPNCFLYPPKPLAKKMEAKLWEKELLKPENKRHSKPSIHSFLERYTNSLKYKECFIEGVCRVDLEGSEITPITKAEAELAASEVKEIIAAHQYSAH